MKFLKFAFIFTFTFIGLVNVCNALDPFPDMQESGQYASDAVYYLKINKIVEGYPDGTFKPDNEINRAEFVKIVLESADIKPGGSNCFPDVTDQWFAPYVCKAKEESLIKGYPDGTFKPDQNINFVEASKIVSKAFNLEINSELNSTWYEKYVVALENKYFIPPTVTTFDYAITRADMACITGNIMFDGTIYHDGTCYSNTNYIKLAGLNDVNTDAVKNKILDGAVLDFYEINGDVHVLDIFGVTHLLEESSPETFKKAFRDTYQDNHQIYTIPDYYYSAENLDEKIKIFRQSELPFDLPSLEFINQFTTVSQSQSWYFIKDKDNLFASCTVETPEGFKMAEGSDPENFKLLTLGGQFVLFTDNKYLYMGYLDTGYACNYYNINVKKIDEVDMNSFYLLTPVYFKDNKNLYFLNYEPQKNGNTFMYLKTGDSITTIPGISDLSTLNAFVSEEYINTNIFKDSSNVYLLNADTISILEDADAETFEMIEHFDSSYFFDDNYLGYYFKDKNYIWIIGDDNSIIDKISISEKPNFDYEQYLIDQNQSFWRELG